ncbi:hypothetical protein GCM10011360_01050 [Primorskyibacter flagellatus]|uniref:Glycosyltransferase 2-like domain-containing protein n=1 Tax=Primorskyibacter flagellatus TaxID=1387277 RepID=A0A917EAD5_9RHOB|nr:glycosyltransferase family A protein [Primorskyibacter flagellatus]GGE16083.1 hypothetical protein GCM10011360_01050 [Primorskyibacter flagellatus]
MSEPYFSVILPMYKRPALARDALGSVLAQSFTDFEVIVSNNGAEPEVRDAIADLISDPRVTYLEFPEALPMPRHWETLSLKCTGRYVTVLPDRSVLYSDALEQIRAQHDADPARAEIVAWAWDIFHSDAQLLQKRRNTGPKTTIIDSDKLMIDQIHAQSYPQTIPRGLNSCVDRRLIDEIRAQNGEVFGVITPDFIFAYNCMMRRPEFVFINDSLAVSQGLAGSTGTQARMGDLRGYLSLFDSTDLFSHVPCDASIVENAIFQDFLLSADRNNRPDLADRIDRAVYYSKCFAEIAMKRRARILSRADIDAMEAKVTEALSREPLHIRQRVEAARTARPPLRSWVRGQIKGRLGARLEAIRPLLMRLRGARRVDSLLFAVSARD